MKGIINLALAGAVIFAASSTFAADMTKTDVNANWICTTNASSPTSDADKAADDQMAKTPASASSAFNMASQNCRDCTKITCESQSTSATTAP